MSSPASLPWRPSRRAFAQLAVLVPWLARPRQERAVQAAADGEPRTVAPPGEPAGELRRRLDGVVAALTAGATTSAAVLADPASNELRPFPLFRRAIAEHAPVGRAQLTPRGEPGTPLLATVRVVDRHGKPYPGVLVYAYQTCAKGWYAAEAPHVSGNPGDFGHARLFTYGRTDANGALELVTVHPSGYPRTDLPSHVHLLLEGRDGDERGTEIRFEDCPRMTPAVRAESLRAGYVVAPVEKLEGGGARCTAEFRLPA